MSQNKTVVPGMENGGSRKSGDSADFYSRDFATKIPGKGTIVPGMENTRNRENMNDSQEALHGIRPDGRPVVGFLYSISRYGLGEYWPVCIGQNTIGSSSGCAICLREATISAEHAVLVVRKMKNPEKIIASISDARSTNGTMVNGESLGFSAVECFHGDVITIGENYELVLLLVDANTLRLKVSDKFMLMDHVDDEPDYSDDPPRFDENRNPYTRPDRGTGTTEGTVGMDGNRIKPGGTIGL